MSAWEKRARGGGPRAKATSRKTPPPALSSARDWWRSSRPWRCRRAARPPARRARPAKHQGGFVDGAVGGGLSRTEFLLTETMDQAHSQQFHRQLGRSGPAAMPVRIQAGAGFHLRAGAAHLPGNVRVLTLPAHSPELNPLAGLWGQVKDGLRNRVFETLDQPEAGLRAESQRCRQDARRARAPIFGRLLDQANASSPPIMPS